MKQLWFPLVSCLILGSLPLDAVHAQQRSVVRVALPGTIEPVILDHIGPAFTAATGYRLEVPPPPPLALVKPEVNRALLPQGQNCSPPRQKKVVFRAGC